MKQNLMPPEPPSVADFQRLERKIDHILANIFNHNSKMDNRPKFNSKINSHLGKIELTVLLWLLAEARYFEFESHHLFVKFLEDNFNYYNEKSGYTPVTNAGIYMSRMTAKEALIDPNYYKNKLLDALSKISLGNDSILVRNKWSK